MAWNEPGNNNRDPWGNRQNDGPPDLDEFFKSLQDKISRFFGGGGGQSSGNSGSFFNLGLVAALIAFIWLIWGSHFIDEQERGVVLQFGKYVDTRQPGYNFVFVPFQKLIRVNVSAFRATKDRAQMLTVDENIVDIEYAVQYNINSPEDYLFSVRDPDLTLIQAAESAIREVTGKNTMDYVITSGRTEISPKAKELLQEILDRYESGIRVITLNLMKAQPPQAVQGAFEDAIKAREDEQRYINEAEAYRNEIIPLARGNALRMVEEAKAYKAKIEKSSEGEADRFLKLLAEYKKAPRVTRERLYIETIESVMKSSSKVMVDVEGGNSLLYLPLDRLMSQERTRVSVEPVMSRESTQMMLDESASTRDRNNLRLREGR